MKAYGDNLVVTPIKQDEDAAIKTPDGMHPWAYEVISVGSQVNNNIDNDEERVEPEKLICAAGEGKEFIRDHFLIHRSQVKAIVTEDEL